MSGTATVPARMNATPSANLAVRAECDTSAGGITVTNVGAAAAQPALHAYQ
jgi:hypothetical protein